MWGDTIRKIEKGVGEGGLDTTAKAKPQGRDKGQLEKSRQNTGIPK